jgi:predicted ATP-dependent serine protease
VCTKLANQRTWSFSIVRLVERLECAPLSLLLTVLLRLRFIHVSRQLQAVDYDVDGGIVMKEIAVGLCLARGLLSSLSRNSYIEVDNQAIIHSSF